MPPVVPTYIPPFVPLEVMETLPPVDWMKVLSYMVKPQVPEVALIVTAEAELTLPPVPCR